MIGSPGGIGLNELFLGHEGLLDKGRKRLVIHHHATRFLIRFAASFREVFPMRFKWIVIVFVILVVVPATVFAIWTWSTLNYSYAHGERAGFVQKISQKGWLCKTWEGELAMVGTCRAMNPEIFPSLSVRDPRVVEDIKKSLGQGAWFWFGDQHIGIPTSCFGETQYFIADVSPCRHGPRHSHRSRRRRSRAPSQQSRALILLCRAPGWSAVPFPFWNSTASPWARRRRRPERHFFPRGAGRACRHSGTERLREIHAHQKHHARMLSLGRRCADFRPGVVECF